MLMLNNTHEFSSVIKMKSKLQCMALCPPDPAWLSSFLSPHQSRAPWNHHAAFVFLSASAWAAALARTRSLPFSYSFTRKTSSFLEDSLQGSLSPGNLVSSQTEFTALRLRSCNTLHISPSWLQPPGFVIIPDLSLPVAHYPQGEGWGLFLVEFPVTC